jgi:DNA-binding MarR family transcriptional regulator
MIDNKEIGLRVVTTIRRIMRAIDLYSRQLAKNYQLTGPQLILLKEIKRLGEAPIGELAKNINLSNATRTGIVDRLEKRGLAKRNRNGKDRRQVNVQITAEGVAILEKAPSPLQDRFLAELGGLDLTERQIILDSLEKIARMMNAENIDASPLLITHPPTASETTLDPNPDNSSPK